MRLHGNCTMPLISFFFLFYTTNILSINLITRAPLLRPLFASVILLVPFVVPSDVYTFVSFVNVYFITSMCCYFIKLLFVDK